MAVQDKLDDEMNVLTHALYHQVLKEKIEQSQDLKLEFEIVVLERFKNMLKNLATACERRRPDYIFFHIRANHYLRLIQPIGRIHGKYQKGSYKVNIGLLKGKLILNDYQAPLETLDKELAGHQHQHTSLMKRIYRKLRLKKLWEATRFVRTVLGILIGNLYYADTLYFKTIDECLNYTSSRNIDMIFIGIVSRPADRLDNWLSARLNKKFSEFLNHRAPYIDVFGTHDEAGNFLFKRDLIHINEIAHMRVARKVYTILNDKLQHASRRSLPNVAVASGG
jgi:disulfide oxidoreductase YuzD